MKPARTPLPERWRLLLEAKRWFGWRTSLTNQVSALSARDRWNHPSRLEVTPDDQGPGRLMTVWGPDGVAHTVEVREAVVKPVLLALAAAECVGAVAAPEHRHRIDAVKYLASNRPLESTPQRADEPPPACDVAVMTLTAPHGPDFDTCATDSVRVGVPAAA